MIVSTKGEYALKAIFDLASQPAGEPVRIAAISKRQRIPQKFLEVILAGLKQGGFVESRRGAEGGYLLARPADSITVGQVLRAVEGADAARGRTGRRQPDTPFTALWRELDEAVSGILDSVTFAELVRRWAEQRREYVPNWEI